MVCVKVNQMFSPTLDNKITTRFHHTRRHRHFRRWSFYECWLWDSLRFLLRTCCSCLVVSKRPLKSTELIDKSDTLMWSTSVTSSLKYLIFYGTVSWNGLIPMPKSLATGSIWGLVKKFLYEKLAVFDPLCGVAIVVSDLQYWPAFKQLKAYLVSSPLTEYEIKWLC